MILEIYVVPPKLLDAIRRMYTDVKISIKLGKVEVEFFQTVGVKQGDNMTPVLFLFLMTAFFELPKQEFESNNIERRIR